MGEIGAEMKMKWDLASYRQTTLHHGESEEERENKKEKKML